MKFQPEHDPTLIIGGIAILLFVLAVLWNSC